MPLYQTIAAKNEISLITSYSSSLLITSSYLNDHVFNRNTTIKEKNPGINAIKRLAKMKPPTTTSIKPSRHQKRESLITKHSQRDHPSYYERLLASLPEDKQGTSHLCNFIKPNKQEFLNNFLLITLISKFYSSLCTSGFNECSNCTFFILWRRFINNFVSNVYYSIPEFKTSACGCVTFFIFFFCCFWNLSFFILCIITVYTLHAVPRGALYSFLPH